MKLSSTFFYSAARGLLMALVVAIPFIYLPVPWIALAQTKMLLITSVAMLMALCWTIAVSMDGKLSVPKSVPLALAGLLPIVYVASSLFSQAPLSLVGSGTEPDTAASIVLLVTLFAGVAVLLTSEKLMKGLYRVLLVSVVIVEIVQIGLILFANALTSLSLSIPAASIVGSWHDLGALLVAAVILSVAVLESPLVRGSWRALPWVAIALAFPLLIVVNAVDIWIALAALAFAATGYTWYIGWKKQAHTGESAEVPQRFSFGIFTAVFIVSLSFVFIGSSVAGALPGSLRVNQGELRPSWQATAEVAQSVYRNGGLVFGSGPNTFNQQWGLHKPDGINETAYWYADFAQGFGLVPTAFITVGLLGAIAWIVFLLSLAYTAGRGLFSSVIENDSWRLPFFGLSAGVVYFWAMLVLYTPGLAMLALTFLLTGALIASGAIFGITKVLSWEFSRSRYGFAFIIVPTVVVLGVGAAGLGIGRALAAEMLVNRGINTYNTTGNASAAQEDINRALSVLPNNDRALRAAVEMNLVRFSQLSQGADGNDSAVTSQLQDVLRQAISNGLTAVSANSNNYQNWLTLAGVYQQLAGVQVGGAYDNAKSAYESALTANPSSPIPYVRLAQLAGIQGDLPGAKAYLLEALDKKSNYADAHYLLSELYLTEGNLEDAYTEAVAAVNAAPGESLLWYQLGFVLYKQANYSDSIAALERALALNANYANALFVMGYALNDAGNTQRAQIVFERTLSLNPENELLIEIVNNLRAGVSIPTFAR